eukprot:Rhum_TRINITY_DN13620_c1_g1::Rhum_TRINITY_DN13620_c1_g1_i1::g.62099::m.62099
MEDQGGYAGEWRPNNAVDDDEGDHQWPTVAYTMRDSLASLALSVSLSGASSSAVTAAVASAASERGVREEVRELVVAKADGVPLGLRVRAEAGGVWVACGVDAGSVADEAGLGRFVGDVLTRVNGVAPADEAHVAELLAEGVEARLQFAGRGGGGVAGAGSAQESFAAIGWQQKMHHPRDLLAIWERGPEDLQHQELLSFLQEYGGRSGGGGGGGGVTREQAQHLYAQVAAEGGGEVRVGAAVAALQRSGLFAAADAALQSRQPADGVLTEHAWLQLVQAEAGAAAAQEPPQCATPEELEAAFEEVLASTRFCTYLAGEPEARQMRARWAESVTTAAADWSPHKLDFYENMHSQEAVDRQHDGPVFKHDARYRPVARRTQLDDTDVQRGAENKEMWIVAAFGYAARGPGGRLQWVTTHDVPLAHIEAIGKTAFRMWPPLSDLGAVVAQRRRNADEVADEPRATKPYAIKQPPRMYSISVRDSAETSPAGGGGGGGGDASEEGSVQGDTPRPQRPSHAGRDKDEASEKRREMLNRVIVAHYRQMQTAKRDGPEAGVGFSAAPQDECRVHFFGDIMSAGGFEAPNLFIRFELVLPPGGEWRVDSVQHTQTVRGADGAVSLVCFTQTSQMVRRRGEGGMWESFYAFGMPFELHCVCASSSRQHPRMMLEVHSERHLGSQRLEGYAVLQLTPSPGAHRTVVQCWKPVQSVRQSLREFFLGITGELEDPSFVSVPAGHTGPFVNKFGFHSETTGHLEVRWNCLAQQPDDRGGAGGETVRTNATAVIADTTASVAVPSFGQSHLRIP